MTDTQKKSNTRTWLDPSSETLFNKLFFLRNQLERFRTHRNLDDEQKNVLSQCGEYIETVSGYLEKPLINFGWPVIRRRHPHLMWQLLHRVDENLVLLMDDDELYSKAVEVKVAFDMNIKETKLRSQWLGANGVLDEIIRYLRPKAPAAAESHSGTAARGKAARPEFNYRHLLKGALQMINEQTDMGYWQLSMNMLTSALSGFFLILLMLLAWIFRDSYSLVCLGSSLNDNDYTVLVALGLMGAHLSNIMTRENFLYVRGGPYLRCLFHNIVSKPVMSAFAAVLVCLAEKTKLIFSIGAPAQALDGAKTASELVILNVDPANAGYVYALLAIVSAFSADKLLRSMFDSVLRRLQVEADKTMDSGEGAK